MKRGFTLVEILVVITIIGILVSLVTVGAYAALEAAKRTMIRVELASLETALHAYSNQYGDYPPSDLREANKPAIVRHLSKAFPRIADASTTADRIIALDLNPAEALVFWLMGHTKDATNPVWSTSLNSRQPFMDFNETQLDSGSPTLKTGWAIDGATGNAAYTKGIYHPRPNDAPYVYFEYRSYWHHNNNPVTIPGMGTCKPYMNDPNSDSQITVSEWDSNGNGTLDASEQRNLFVNSNSFQLISAGLDKNFGGEGEARSFPGATPSSVLIKLFPAGIGYNAEDDDNLAGFSDKQLGDAKP